MLLPTQYNTQVCLGRTSILCAINRAGPCVRQMMFIHTGEYATNVPSLPNHVSSVAFMIACQELGHQVLSRFAL